MDSKLTHDGLGFQWNSERKTFWTLTFELLVRNIALLHFKTERVAATTLRESLFWTTSSRFRGTWGIFFSSGDCKLLPEGLALQLNGHSITFWTLTFELLGLNIQPRHFKTKRVAQTALRASWFWQTSARFNGTWGIFWCHGDCKLSPDVAWFAVKWTQQNFLNFHFRASGPKYSPSSL